MVWLVFLLLRLEALGYANFIMPGGAVFRTILHPRDKPFRRRWVRTRLASSASKLAIHYAIASRHPTSKSLNVLYLAEVLSAFLPIAVLIKFYENYFDLKQKVIRKVSPKITDFQSDS